MAIIWKDPTNVAKDTYEGRVLSTRCARNVHVIDDVWADLYYARVWTGTEVHEISIGNSMMGMEEVVIDATEEVKAAVKAWEKWGSVKLYLEDIPEDYRTPTDEQLWEVYDQILYVKWGFTRWEHYLRTIGMTRSKANRVVNRQYTARAVEKVIAR